jgi:hypothetical protein
VDVASAGQVAPHPDVTGHLHGLLTPFDRGRAVHHRRGGEDALLEHLADRHGSVTQLAECLDLVCVEVMDQRILRRCSELGMAVQEVDLSLQFVLVDPVIVPFTERVVVTGQERLQVRTSVDSLREDIPLLEHGLDHARIAGQVCLDDLTRTVGGRVVVHENPEGERGALREETVQRVGNECHMVVRDALDRHQGMLMPSPPARHEFRLVRDAGGRFGNLEHPSVR